MLAGTGAGLLGGMSSIFLAWNAFASSTELRIAAAARDYSTKDTYDWLVNTLGPADQFPSRPIADETAFWTWSQSPVMRTYLMAYRKWGQTQYLDKMVDDADLMLSERDNERGVTDWQGLSLPAWRHAGQYTAGSGNVPAVGGAALLRLRIGITGPADRRRGTATVTAGATPGRFTIVATSHTGETTTTFTNLTMDPASPDYVVPRLYWADPNPLRITALDRRPTPTAGVVPAPGTYALTADFTHGYVDTGVIAQNLAEFADIVLSNPALVAYNAKAHEYLAAAKAALAVHDDSWQENGSGEGWFVILPEHPSAWAGSDLPHNQNLAIAKAYLHIADAGGGTEYYDRAEMLLRRFRNDLVSEDLPGANGPFNWYYAHPDGLFFKGWTRAQLISKRIPYSPGYKAIEDVSHAMLDVAAAAFGAQHGLIFTTADMQRFAKTFNDRMFKINASGNPTLATNVNGTGTLGTYDSYAGSFGRLKPWSQLAYNNALAIFNFRQYAANRGSIAESIGVLTTSA